MIYLRGSRGGRPKAPDLPTDIYGGPTMADETGKVERLSPDGMHKNPAYSQLVVVSGPARTIYVGGQNAVDASGAIVGKGDITAQTAQILHNLRTALAAAGAELKDVIKFNVHIVQGQDI